MLSGQLRYPVTLVTEISSKLLLKFHSSCSMYNMLQLVDRIENVSCNSEVYLGPCILDTSHMVVPFNL